MGTFKGSDNSYVCYDGNGARILNQVDKKFCDEALNLGAEEYHIPAMIDKSVLYRCGYFSSFPQHITVASHACSDMYSKISEENNLTSSSLVTPTQFFTPAACLHIYPMLENQNISQKVVTTKARVYRYEKDGFDGETRLWDFTVREIVFIGDEKYVLNSLETMKTITQNYTKELGIQTELLVASDSFYPNKKNKIKQKIQKNNSLKFELCAKYDDKNIPIASFNYHNTHFSKPFNFDKSGTIVTGCVGFGLERWVKILIQNNK